MNVISAADSRRSADFSGDSHCFRSGTSTKVEGQRTACALAAMTHVLTKECPQTSLLTDLPRRFPFVCEPHFNSPRCAPLRTGAPRFGSCTAEQGTGTGQTASNESNAYCRGAWCQGNPEQSPPPPPQQQRQAPPAAPQQYDSRIAIRRPSSTPPNTHHALRQCRRLG